MIPRIRRDGDSVRNAVSRQNRVPAKCHPAIAARASACLVRFRICAIVIALCGTLAAQDTEPVEPLTVDEQTVDPDESTEPAPTPLEQESEDLRALAGRILAEMRDAESRLANGQLDAETGDLQEQINSNLTKLLEALEQQAAQPAPSSDEDAQQQASGQDPSAAGGTGDPGQLPTDSTAGESTEGDRPGTLSAAELARRRNLATSVWGHLPERERDEMLGAFSERFLPAYDELVRQYYEALATQNAQDR